VARRANLVAPGDMKRRASQDVRGGALEVGGSREVRDEVACEGGGASWGGGGVDWWCQHWGRGQAWSHRRPHTFVS
jgi:hypothetical protein